MKTRMYSTLIQTINDMKLRDKLMFMFVAVVFFPMMIVGIFLTNELRSNAIQDAIQQSQVNVERVKERTTEVLNVPVLIANNLQFDERFIELVNREYETTYDVVSAYRQYKNFTFYLQYYPEIHNMKFYSENQTLMNNWAIIPIGHEGGEEWFMEAMTDPAYNRWVYLEDETKKNQAYLSMVRRLNFLNHGSAGVLVITIDPRKLDRILQQESFATMIVDERNRIAATNQREYIGKDLHEVIDFHEMIQEGPAIYEGKVNGEPSQIIVDYLTLQMSQSELKIISIVTNEHIMKDAKRLSMMGATVTMGGMAVAVMLIVHFSWLISKRLSHLSERIDQVASGDLKTKIVVDGKDEIGQLSVQFNQMVANVRSLIHQVHETNRQKRLLEKSQNEIKLKMLASQINPHFLFNTLESIRMKSHMKGETEIAKVVKQLGKLMRKSLDVTGHRIPLRNELDMVRCYLEIQTFRYGDRLHYELYIDPQSEMVEILPLIIQPLVENAVIHGLERTEDGGTVTISTIVNGNDLTVIVNDDGCGMDEEKLEAIQNMLHHPQEVDGNKIGLLNVHKRLQLTYGKPSGLIIESAKGKGTCVRFSISQIRGDDDV
ncbi:sensor histidine kinase [Halalkalibacterium halodurans]|nr:sensor histidine kinase [Halalkalibacterium halodurans]TPE71008.1 sensor histidine kinase [Halalkalibacterium halodurans]